MLLQINGNVLPYQTSPQKLIDGNKVSMQEDTLRGEEPDFSEEGWAKRSIPLAIKSIR